MPERASQVTINLISPYAMDGPNGGVQKHIRQYAEFLTNNGVSSQIVTPRLEGKEPNNNYAYLGNATRRTHKGTQLYTSRGLSSPWEVAKVSKDYRAHINHYHEPEISGGAMEHLAFSKAVNFVTFHSHNAPDWRYNFFMPIRYPYSKLLTGRIVVSPAAHEFANHYFPGEYSIIPNGLKTDDFRGNIEPITEFKDDKLNILFVGRLEERKGLSYLLDAYARVKRNNNDIRLIVVGEGPQKQEYENKIKKDGIGDVHFAGRVTDQELPRYYKTADVFSSPATHGESFGIVLLEAMAAEAPIICANNPGYISLIEDGSDALVVDPKNEIQYAYQLNLMIEQEDLRKNFKKNGLKKALAHDWVEVGPRILKYYIEGLNSRKKTIPRELEQY